MDEIKAQACKKEDQLRFIMVMGTKGVKPTTFGYAIRKIKPDMENDNLIKDMLEEFEEAIRKFIGEIRNGNV